MPLDKDMLLKWSNSRKSELEQACEQSTGYHKRHLTGQHSTLVDLLDLIESGTFDIKEEDPNGE